MNLQKCKNGHYYDQDKFVKCPYCVTRKMPLKDTLVLDGAADAHTRKEENVYDGELYEDEAMTQASLRDAVVTAMRRKAYQEMELSASSELDQGEDNVIPAANGLPEKMRQLPGGVLVAIDGSCKGRIYALMTGDNYLLAERDTVCIQNELASDRQPQASVCYDAEQNLFVLRLLDETSDIWIGKMRLEDNVRLVPYDTIIIGEDILLFVPICGDQFRWG